MPTLTVTARGQVTLRKALLRHLGVEAGDQIELDLLPGGRGVITKARPRGNIENFIGLLAGKTRKVAALAEIAEATQAVDADGRHSAKAAWGRARRA